MPAAQPVVSFAAFRQMFGVKTKKRRKRGAKKNDQDKLAALLLREKEWTTRLKRAQTFLKKIRRQRKYYAKRIADVEELQRVAKERATWDI